MCCLPALLGGAAEGAVLPLLLVHMPAQTMEGVRSLDCRLGLIFGSRLGLVKSLVKTGGPFHQICHA